VLEGLALDSLILHPVLSFSSLAVFWPVLSGPNYEFGPWIIHPVLYSGFRPIALRALGWLRSATPSAYFIRCAPHAALATPRGIIALRRLPRSGRWFAPLAASEISRLLTAIASLANSRRGVEPCSCRRPSAPFGWESLHRAATRSGTLCHPAVRGGPSCTHPRSPRRTERHDATNATGPEPPVPRLG
jgi:hypothetical protein